MTFDFGEALFYTLLFAPVLTGLLGVRLPPDDRFRSSLVGTGLMLLGSVGLALLGEQEFTAPITFMNEPITFSISMTGLYLYIGLLLALLALLWLDSRKARRIPLFTFLLIHFSVSAGFLALMSGQFMIRYIALDLVGLIIALAILSSFHETHNLRRFIVVFQVLRLGDLFLLVAILLTNALAGTYDITRMIATASAMPPANRAWVFLGFILAVLIKLAVWPFGIWLRYSREDLSGAAFWVSGVLMPGLGFYLLYRIQPILHADPLFQRLLLCLSLGIFLLTLFVHWRRWVDPDGFLLLSGLISCFALAGAAIPGTDHFGHYLAALVLIRLVFLFEEIVKHAPGASWVGVPLILVNGLFLWANSGLWTVPFMLAWGALTLLLVWITSTAILAGAGPEKQRTLAADPAAIQASSEGLLDRSAAWVKRGLETKLFSSGYSTLTGSLVSLAAWLREHVEAAFEKAWSGVTKGLMRTSEATLATLEVKPAERTDDLVDQAIHKLSVYENTMLKKNLRWDLALIPLFLLVIIVLLLIV